MRPGLRHVFNNAFTIYSVLAIVLMAATLLVILGPMLARGATAVAFQGSVEFRQMQLNEFGRGDRAAVTAEVAQVEAARQNVYDLLEGFQRGIDVSGLEDRARHILREFRQQLRNRVSAAQMTDEQYDQLTQRGQHVRDLLLDAYETTDKATAEAALDKALALCQGDVFAGTVAEAFAAQGDDYRKVIQQIDLSHRQEYAEQLKDVQENLTWLFGPRPGQATADLAVYRYGATRRDMAEKRLHELLYAEKWVPTGPGQQLKKTYVPRADIFADTSLAGLFGLVQQNFEQMMHFRWTIYWHYFSDAGIQGHYFGGVGPEILGTILLSLLAMAFAVPLGVITGAYLAESDAEGIFIRIIRTCINGHAGPAAAGRAVGRDAHPSGVRSYQSHGSGQLLWHQHRRRAVTDRSATVRPHGADRSGAGISLFSLGAAYRKHVVGNYPRLRQQGKGLFRHGVWSARHRDVHLDGTSGRGDHFRELRPASPNEPAASHLAAGRGAADAEALQ